MTVSYIGHIGIKPAVMAVAQWRESFLFEWAPSWYFHDSQPNKSI
jgi:hypothetical protein